MKNFLTMRWLTPKKALIITIFIFGFLLITNGDPFVRSDGFCYFTIDKSLIDQHSFVSSVEPEYWDYMGHVKETFDGKYISVCSPGAALFNLPGLIIANLFKGDRNITNDYFIAYNGHTFLEGVSYLITAMLVGLGALVLIYKTLRNLKFSERLSMFSTALVFVSSYALWYIFIYPSFTHIYEIFGVALTLFGFVKYLNNSNRKNLLTVGVGIGIMIITRPVLVPIALVIFLYLLYKRDFKGIVHVILGGIPFGIVYAGYNFVSYGSIIASGYGDVRGETFQFSQFHGLDVLFSAYRGLFVYTPILLLSVVGLVVLWKKSKILSVLGITSLISLATIYGFWPAWWGGGSYGSRFMMFFVPFGCIGLAELMKFLKANYRRLFKAVIALSLIFTLYSGSILLFYRVTPVGSGFYTPLHFFKTQIQYIQEAGSILGYFKELPSHIQDASGFVTLATGISDYVVTVRPVQVEANGQAYNTNKLDLRMFAPPRSTQPLPDTIKFYIANKSTGIVYQAEIDNFKPTQEITLTCDVVCTSDNPAFKDLGTVKNPETLSVVDYEGINFNDFNFFFQKGANIQFRGNLILWVQADPFFKVLN